ncbi:ABC transporter ATP-binding protein [Georgenia sp. Z1491]|uniref:ABC transporter ATP-binding protein n=1 Tax=Georgenia sp. Z1491 TaxID=3416707 RepID=UPI003CEB1AAC
MITTEHLTKTYGSRRVVDDLTFTAPPGSVTAFLGPNGAGKSTTMRMICALARPTGGSARVGGEPFTALANPGRVVGQLLDSGALHRGRTGAEILRLALLTVDRPTGLAGELLERVGLTGAADRRVRAYSLGMRQRLGLAVALAGDPGILVLDEPFNGLDPEGIRWFRGVLRDFADDGGTVLLSSHLLAEVQTVADRYVVIGAGRLRAEGTAAELLGSGSVRVDAADRAALVAALGDAGLETLGAETPSTSAGVEVRAGADEVGRAAQAAGIPLTLLAPASSALEDAFLSLTAA